MIDYEDNKGDLDTIALVLAAYILSIGIMKLIMMVKDWMIK